MIQQSGVLTRREAKSPHPKQGLKTGTKVHVMRDTLKLCIDLFLVCEYVFRMIERRKPIACLEA